MIYAPSGIRKRDESAEYWASYSRRKCYPGRLLNSTRVGFTAALRPPASTYTPVNEPMYIRTHARARVYIRDAPNSFLERPLRITRSGRPLPRVCFIKLGHFTARAEH